MEHGAKEGDEVSGAYDDALAEEAQEFARIEARKVRTWAGIVAVIGGSVDTAMRAAERVRPEEERRIRLPVFRDHRGIYAPSVAILRAWMLDTVLPYDVAIEMERGKRAASRGKVRRRLRKAA